MKRDFRQIQMNLCDFMLFRRLSWWEKLGLLSHISNVTEGRHGRILRDQRELFHRAVQVFPGDKPDGVPGRQKANACNEQENYQQIANPDLDRIT